MKEYMLKQYSILVEFLGKVLGPDYEIVLHDLTDKTSSVVAIANGHVSGRSIGAPLTNLGLKTIAMGNYKNSDYLINYNGASRNNRVLRSSTMFIKDENEEIVAMLCINFDDSKYITLSEEILKLCHPNDLMLENSTYDSVNSILNDVPENFSESISEVTETVLNKVLADENIPIDRLTQDERLNIVDILNQKGVFMLKGAVSEVANQLQCSEPSIYRYLSIINKDKNKDKK
ncbi:Predicted transcriptional regulator YheO, contains PAS and DNA-binding HTH domains [Clostridium cochlearium]|uniref:Predicted transcriptional regulator YheO, contains PAS and DNA-binding HTH domains n=1 Tax=Clostridium cochlearium TaxID=1494 RepID=A0ABY0QPY4_CLOCO|nr:PAS domain-containing protein [Clostridium cochlearium]SDL46083.1 Predicted transcriptional regulator YheO, contains PAS and DNA-binding HTH domains [Clostridium cochlearium]